MDLGPRTAGYSRRWLRRHKPSLGIAAPPVHETGDRGNHGALSLSLPLGVPRRLAPVFLLSLRCAVCATARYVLRSTYSVGNKVPYPNGRPTRASAICHRPSCPARSGMAFNWDPESQDMPSRLCAGVAVSESWAPRAQAWLVPVRLARSPAVSRFCFLIPISFCLPISHL